MTGGPVSIKVHPEATPRQAYSTRSIPIHLREAFDRELDEQLAAGILEEAEDTSDPSEWLHPMVVTRKKDVNKCRITVDLRDLNRVTVRPVYPAMSPWQTVSTIPASAKFFSVLDGLKGFHQVALDEASRRLTTFVTPRGRMRYRRMPMGWCGSSDVFHERMAKALEHVPNVARVVEDVLVYSDTEEQHEEAVARVLEAMDRHDISVNLEKVQFCLPRVKFGGFVLSHGSYVIDDELTNDL
jgi:Reverse transcriptase (RNA-dependent DNA polymerase)